MKSGTLCILLIAILAFGCNSDNEVDFSLKNLKDGEFYLKLYDANGKLLLTTKGDASYLPIYSGGWQLVMTDPTFATKDATPNNTFAWLGLWSPSAVSSPAEFQLQIEGGADLYQRYYSLKDDWNYTSSSGSIKVISVSGSIIKGSFEVRLVKAANSEINTYWGDNLLAIGYFSGECPYVSIGGCP